MAEPEKGPQMEPRDVEGDLSEILYTEQQIHDRIAELCRRIEVDYAGKDLLLVGVLRGAVMVMADLARELKRDIEMDWMAVSSYGNSTESSGVVRIVKDLDLDITGREVILVEDIVDSGLTLHYLLKNLRGRGPASRSAPERSRRGTVSALRAPTGRQAQHLNARAGRWLQPTGTVVALPTPVGAYAPT